MASSNARGNVCPYAHGIYQASRRHCGRLQVPQALVSHVRPWSRDVQDFEAFVLPPHFQTMPIWICLTEKGGSMALCFSIVTRRFPYINPMGSGGILADTMDNGNKGPNSTLTIINLVEYNACIRTEGWSLSNNSFLPRDKGTRPQYWHTFLF